MSEQALSGRAPNGTSELSGAANDAAAGSPSRRADTKLVKQMTARTKVRTAVNEAKSNWRLMLLAVTGIVLSLASGWTTWDGMSNFTCPGGNTDGCVAPRILSFMITFGIQGIMLIAAWLIGETFAANNASQRSYRSGWFTGGMVIASAIIAIGLVGFVLQPDQFGNYAQYATFDPNTLALLKPGLGLIALVGDRKSVV